MAPQSQPATSPPPPSGPNRTNTTQAPTRNMADAHDKDEMPSAAELWTIGTKSLQTGAVTGGIGLLVGAGSGIMRSAPPTLFALVAGLQWFALGSSYMASRSLLWHAWGGEDNMSTSDLVKASGVSGGVSGMVGGMFRGPRNIIPGIMFFGTLGAGSSYVSQRYKSSEPNPKTSWFDSKWSPMQRLSDEDYEEKLSEKLLRLRAEIAIIDDNIEALKAAKQSPTSPKAEARTDAKK
ncbi:Uu.00g002140.m01.CDS01 [Anthostomella pinea]|uniref:Uu.00g002140.m01.CDS01 n=1 Tax=Anthostomella pinea TaxID=933095 RepID=A0AAI8VJF1_9PEZI|nr:Uu.00g002140.m01.CDS01 [Anthostomella pinea]